MIHRLSELLTQYFMKYGQATDKAEVYIYGIECFISEFIGNLLLLIVAIRWHQISAMIIWTLSFLLIRTQLGGFHCKTHFIKHPNHPLSANQIQHARAKCLRNFFVLSVLSVILYLCHLPYYSSICSGIISSCILALMSLKKQFPIKTDMLIL